MALFDLPPVGPQVYNRRHAHVPPNAVYIGRGSKYGNPFVIGEDGDRATVIAKYEQYLYSKPDLLRAVREELQGRDLVCYCKPAACHGDLLLKLANP